MSKFLQKFTVYDLIIAGLMAAVGIAIKPIVVPLTHIISGPLMIPGGAFAGGFYMMWLVMGFGITRKYGTATLIGFIQALLVILGGAIGSHGILSLFSYTMPGLAADIGLFIIGHKVCCRPCAFIAGALANLAGTLSVNFIFFRLPLLFLCLSLFTALLSGGLGGLLAWQLLSFIPKKLLNQFQN